MSIKSAKRIITVFEMKTEVTRFCFLNLLNAVFIVIFYLHNRYEMSRFPMSWPGHRFQWRLWLCPDEIRNIWLVSSLSCLDSCVSGNVFVTENPSWPHRCM